MVTGMGQATTDTPARHYSVQEKLRWLEPNPNLPPHLRDIAESVQSLALHLIEEIADDPQLALGLQHLVDAKDCFVRAKIADTERR